MILGPFVLDVLYWRLAVNAGEQKASQMADRHRLKSGNFFWFHPTAKRLPEFLHSFAINSREGGSTKCFQKQMTHEDPGIECGITPMNSFKVDQKNLCTPHQHVLGAVIAVYQRRPNLP